MTNKNHEDNVSASVQSSASVDFKVKRGAGSWGYIYTLLGFVLTIETGVMGLIVPIKWPWNFVSLLVLATLTIYLFLYNGWFQNKLIGFKIRYEEQAR